MPQSLVKAGAGRGGSKALVLRNEVGRQPHLYRNLTRALEPVRPGGRYVLTCWMRGQGETPTEGVIGVCSDPWGNEAFSYADHGALDDEWREVKLPFSGPAGGRLNVIVRNDTRIEGPAIDDVRVEAER